MTIQLDITIPMLDRIEDYLAVRAIEIDGHIERATVADQGLSLILCAGRKAIRDERRKKSKISKEPKASCKLRNAKRKAEGKPECKEHKAAQ